MNFHKKIKTRISRIITNQKVHQNYIMTIRVNLCNPCLNGNSNNLCQKN